MQKLDPNALFSIFDQGDEQIYREHKIESDLNSPFIIMGTVITGIDNFYLLDKMYSFKFQDSYGKVRDKIKYKYFNKMYNYLLTIDEDKIGDSFIVDEELTIERYLFNLNDLLYFFQELEQYEKCAHIVKFTNELYSRKLESII